MDTTRKEVLVYGCGKSGISAAALLLKTGSEPILYDQNEKTDAEAVAAQVREKSGKEFSAERIRLGRFPEDLPRRISLAVLSPGIPCDIPEVGLLKSAGVEVIGEIELAYRAGKGSVYAITGTNGKTTTTMLLGDIMKASFPEVYVVGNIGNPYTDSAANQTDRAVTVAEISSFQLETCDRFHPRVSVITNITEDHLNRHHTMEEYIRVKEKIAARQTEADLCVLNHDDPVLRAFGGTLRCRVGWFSSTERLADGMYYEDGVIYLSKNGAAKPLFETGGIRILGLHNYENVMAASLAALFAGVKEDILREVVYAFPGVAHRIEYICTAGGVSYYNDSKGTNPDASVKAVLAMPGSTLLIAGGFDKNSEYTNLIRHFKGKIRKLILIGATAEKIARDARRCGFPKDDIVQCGTLDRAVAYCAAEAKDGESVLLSPACASWDQFTCFEERGDRFRELVRGMVK